MKTKEFIRRLKELGFIYGEDGNIYRENNLSHSICWVSSVFSLSLDTSDMLFRGLDGIIIKELFYLLIEYTKTPIEEREEEKQYYLRHKYINKRNAYLVVDENQNCSLQVIGVDYELPTSNKAKFTEKEIENIKDYNKTDLADFELVEV